MKNRAQIKVKARRILRAAEEALMEGLGRATAFVDAEDFKHALIGHLHLSKPFAQAARDLHGPLSRLSPGPGVNSERSEIARKIHFGGRVQSARHDPSVGQPDRQRGHRAPGGKRVGQGKVKSKGE